MGDKLYGKNNPPNPPYVKGRTGNAGLDFNQLALHALSIKLELPNHTHITIESPLPPEFEEAKNLLKKAKN
jgi:23S rRNA-/tRNA-specific pseudouridylate synthase